MIKRTIAALLSCLLLPALFSGCMQTEGETPETAEPAETRTLAAVSTEAEGISACVAYARNQNASIRLILPEGWRWDSYEYTDDRGGDLTLAFYPVDEYLGYCVPDAATGRITVTWYQSFGVCGTGLQSNEITVGKYKATAGAWDGRKTWEFISLPALGPAGRYVIENKMDGEEWAEYGETVMGILQTLVVGEPVSFTLVWNVFGVSSYDSATGRLVKTNDATDPEAYAATYRFTDRTFSDILTELMTLAPEDYPDEYDPFNDPASDVKVMSTPSMNLILTVREGEREKTVSCIDISLSPGAAGYDAKADRFLDFCRWLEELLMNTDEWQALPDYEFYYD